MSPNPSLTDGNNRPQPSALRDLQSDGGFDPERPLFRPLLNLVFRWIKQLAWTCPTSLDATLRRGVLLVSVRKRWLVNVPTRLPRPADRRPFRKEMSELFPR